MSARIRRHIRSNVVGYLALFVALSGTAYAVDGPLPGQNQVGSADIINNDVRSEDIRDANLTTADIRSGAVTSGKVLDDTFAEGGLSAADLAAGSVGASELQTNAIPANGFGDDGSTKLGDNSVNFNELAPDSIEGSKVEDESLSEADLADSSVTPDKIGTIPAARATTPKVASSPACSPVTGQGIPSGTDTVVRFIDESFDTAGLHPTGLDVADNSKLIASRTGIYQLSAGIKWDGGGTGERFLGLRVNGTTFPTGERFPSTPNGGEHSVATLVKLNQDDYVEAIVFQDAGTSICLRDADARNFLAMHWVGPG